jgi:hypothetical protein
VLKVSLPAGILAAIGQRHFAKGDELHASANWYAIITYLDVHLIPVDMKQ